MNLQPISYLITGETNQLLEVTLSPGETIIAEAGAMVYMDEGISYETCLGDGSEPNPSILGKIFPSNVKISNGDTLFLTYFTNYGRGCRKIVLSNPYFGSILHVNLSDFNNDIVIQRNALLCGPKGLKISNFSYQKTGINTKRDILLLQKVYNASDFYINISGTLIERELINETISLDANSIVAFDASIEVFVEAVGGIKTMILGNDAYILATLKGNGKVWLQSNSIPKMIQLLTTNIQRMHYTDKILLGKYFDE